MLWRLTKVFSVLVIATIVWPLFSFAQMLNPLDLSSSFSSELNADIIPSYPRPYEKVSINLTLYTGDLNSAEIGWYVNGQNVLSGTGEKNYSFTTGAAGEVENFEIRIRLADGTSFSKKLSINPAEVQLVWESDSYVPPFYRGKALQAQHGVLRIVAMPEFVVNGKPIPQSNLVYNWSNGQETYPSQSGYGRGVLVINGSLLGKTERVSVVVTEPISGLKAQGWADIPTVRPEIVFYENNPYYGNLFDQAVSNIDLTSEEVQVVAYPLFFSNEGEDGVSYEWRLNNQVVDSLYNLRSAIFRKPEGESGQSAISLSIKNNRKTMQQADSGFIMRWGE